MTDAQGQSAYERRPDLYAVRQPAGAGHGDGAVAIISEDAQTSLAVFRREGPKAPGKVGQALPVYEAGAGGPLAVPTGRVFVRLADEVGVEQRRDALAAAGFTIAQTLSYAPNAAWLTPRTGGVERALAALDALRAVPGVVHVEPQLLLQRAERTGD